MQTAPPKYQRRFPLAPEKAVLDPLDHDPSDHDPSEYKEEQPVSANALAKTGYAKTLYLWKTTAM
jgi:hypothetical protein